MSAVIRSLKVCCLLLIAGLNATCFAQNAPGYLGKRDVLSYRGLIGPSVQPNGPEISGYPDGSPRAESSLGLFYENQLSYERVMTRRFSLRTSLSQQSFHFGTSLGYGYGGFNNDGDYLRITSFIPGNSIGLELAARWYYKHFAPLGWYFEVHVGYQSISYEAAEFERRISMVTENFNTEAGSTSLIPFGIGWGYQRVIQDKYVVGFGTQISAAIISDAQFYYTDVDLTTLQNRVTDAAETGATVGRFFPFFFTLGYLL